MHGYTTWGGRSQVRSILYMATQSAIRRNPPIRAFYRRLVESGKKKMVAVVVFMRKLLVILNAYCTFRDLIESHLERSRMGI